MGFGRVKVDRKWKSCAEVNQVEGQEREKTEKEIDKEKEREMGKEIRKEGERKEGKISNRPRRRQKVGKRGREKVET